jgi:pyruvate/2-oxoglutarate dehydrogenase complex dihydrolipoamide dehydrogenase (E3) component
MNVEQYQNLVIGSFTVFGAEASEMTAVVQTAMLGALPYTALRDAIFTHPTAAEGLIGMFASPLS